MTGFMTFRDYFCTIRYYRVYHNLCTYNLCISGFDITFQWFGKTSTRIPESLSFFFSPIQSSSTVFVQETRRSIVSREMEMNAEKFLHGARSLDLSAEEFTWKVQKLGQIIPADSVMLNGSQYLHCK